VRELINAVERAAALTEHDVLTVEDFPLAGEAGARETLLDQAARDEFTLEELENAYIRRILDRTGGHKARAAKILGLERRTLYRKVAELERRPASSEGPDSSRREDE
jgi:DNA-binding NtrC family response regulator